MRTVIAWLAPVQPLRIEAGAIGSVQVNRTQSLVSSRPTVDPPPLPVVIADPAGVWLSTTSVYVEPVVLTPALSVVMTRTL